MSSDHSPGEDPDGASPEAAITRPFGWQDIFVPPEEDPRTQGGDPAGERDTLTGYLRVYRLTLDGPVAARRDLGGHGRHRARPPRNLAW